MTSILTPDDIAAAIRLRGTAWATIRAIAGEVGELAGIAPEAILGRCRTAKTAEARQVVMFAAHHGHGISKYAIAKAMARDLSTIAHGIDAEAKRRGYKSETRQG